jgi:hypothetical protein
MSPARAGDFVGQRSRPTWFESSSSHAAKSMQSNTILAPIAIATFPLFVLLMFLRYRPPVAVTVSLLVGELALPPNYWLPISPSWLGKWTVPQLSLGLAVLVFGRAYYRRSRPFRGMEGVFLLGLVGSFFTWRTNMDVLQYGPRTLPAHAFIDFQGEAIRLILDPWIVFFLGRIMFKRSRDLVTLTRLMTVTAAIFTIPILYEIRMSPQINKLLYGYMPGAFDQTLRMGGYRPVVCFPDGLHLVSFVLASVLMAVAAARAGKRIGNLPMKGLSIYLFVILIACKSVGAILYGAVFVPMICLGSPRRMTTVAKWMTIFFLAYPFLRMGNLLPTKPIVDWFTSLSADRGESLGFRFDMEQSLLDFTAQRPWWGWGGWGRNFLYDPHTGKELTIVDGAVIIAVSSHGVFGFLTYFLPYGYSVIRAARLIRKIKSRADRIMMSAFAINCAVILFDLIINSAFFPLFMLFFGALYGLSTGIVAEEAQAEAEAEAEAARQRPQPYDQSLEEAPA